MRGDYCMRRWRVCVVAARRHMVRKVGMNFVRLRATRGDTGSARVEHGEDVATVREQRPETWRVQAGRSEGSRASV